MPETCAGTTTTCPTDAKKPAGTACTADANPCTLDQCDGSNVSCQHPAGNAGAVCRGSAGTCDVAEDCTGSSPTCPADGFQASTIAGRGAAGELGLGGNSPGNGPNCPADAEKVAGTACTSDGNPCSLDQCDGTNNLCQHPAGNAGAVCRLAVNECDVTEYCTGASTACPGDGFQPSGTSCAPDNSACTLDVCNGAGSCSHNRIGITLPNCTDGTRYSSSGQLDTSHGPCRAGDGDCGTAWNCGDASNPPSQGGAPCTASSPIWQVHFLPHPVTVSGVYMVPAFNPSCQNFTINIKVRFEGQTTFTTVRTDTCRLLCSNPNGEDASRYNFPFAAQSM